MMVIIKPLMIRDYESLHSCGRKLGIDCNTGQPNAIR